MTTNTKRRDNTWMKNHPLEGDGLVTGFYNFLAKRNTKTMKACRNIMVPDTVVFERNFPRGWYTTDVKAKEVMRKQGKELDAATIEQGFKSGVPGACPIVASYMCTQEEDLGDGKTEIKTMVEVFNKDTIGDFLARKTKHEGILQKFVMPKGYHNSVVKVVWSPRVCLVQRRTNRYPVNDKKRAEADPFSTTVTYEGPSYLSDEGTLSGNVAVQVKRLCGDIVQHFYYTEHKFITRMVVYFKADRQDRLWFLWCGSLRVADRSENSEMPVNLVTNFAEPDSNGTFDEDKLLWEADAAFLRVTNDEMFYETYMKNVKLVNDGDVTEGGDVQARAMNAAEEEEAARLAEAAQAQAAAKGGSSAETFDWSQTQTLVQEAREQMEHDREAMLSTFDDLFYNVRSHFVVHKLEPYTLEISERVTSRLTPNGVVDLMRALQLQARGSGGGVLRYVVEPNSKVPITKMSDDTQEWINAYYDAKIVRLQQAAVAYADDLEGLSLAISEL